MNPEEINFWSEVEKLIRPPKAVLIEYRLYYDELGEIVKCSMVDHEDSGPYVVATPEEYHNYFDYRVVDQQLKKIDRDRRYSVKLTKSTVGFPVVKNHASLPLEVGEIYKDIEYYDYRSS